ncbi:MAG: hypothetical protein LBC56_06080 [Oscillospiraceae bacterium]|nr:hypothetical protein [Oscillospiraceae bacterium]
MLEYIGFDGRLQRGIKMRGEISEGVLNFFVNYNFIAVKGYNPLAMEKAQENLNSAIGGMDVSAVNRAYSQLHSIVDAAESNLRDNVNEQMNFNNALKAGSSEMDVLQTTEELQSKIFLNLGIKYIIF